MSRFSSKKQLRLFFVLSCVIIIGIPFFSAHWSILRIYCSTSYDAPLSKKAKFFIYSGFSASVITFNSFLSLFDSLFDEEESLKNTKLKRIDMKVKRGLIEQIVVKKLDSSKNATYHKASLLYPDGQWKSITFKLRGKSHWHWFSNKPSLRLKLKQKSPLYNQIMLDLVNPEDQAMISNIMADELAQRLHVLTPKAEFVKLYINNKYKGVYHLVTVENEEMLRIQKRIPGPIFLGRTLKKKWNTNQFKIRGDASILSKINPLSEMISTMYLPQSSEKYGRLWNILSFEKCAQGQAALNLSGGIHRNYSHNQIFYFDPMLGLVEPITDDINGYGLLAEYRWFSAPLKRLANIRPHDMPLNEFLHPLLDIALRDPRFYHYRNQVLYRALKGEGSIATQIQLLKDYFKLIGPAVKADYEKASLRMYFSNYFRFPYSNGAYEREKTKLIDWIKRRNIFLMSELNKTNVGIVIEQPVGSKQKMVITISGNSAVYFNPKELDGEIFAHTLLSTKYNDLIIDKLLLYPGLKEDYDFIYYPTQQGDRHVNYHLIGDSQKYVFTVINGKYDHLEEQLKGAFVHALSGENIQPTIKSIAHIDDQDIKYNTVSVHVWKLVYPQRLPNKKEYILGPGEIILKKDLILSKTTCLIVKPNTTLKLGKDVSIVSKGKVLFLGEKRNPIVIKRLDRKHPWGSIAIMGQHSKGSRIRYVHFSGGSVANHFNVSFSGMVSVHDVEDLEVEDSIFDHNLISDDALHIAYGKKIFLKNLIFRNCYADCIDLDYISLANLKGIEIYNAKNDGLDTMTSNVSISNFYIKGAQDKGLSLGEKSIITAYSGIIEKSNIAVAIKDDSQGNFSNIKLRKNQKGIDIYLKNWRYEKPGRGTMEDVSFADNNIDLNVEKEGEIILKNTFPQKIDGSGKIERISSK